MLIGTYRSAHSQTHIYTIHLNTFFAYKNDDPIEYNITKKL